MRLVDVADGTDADVIKAKEIPGIAEAAGSDSQHAHIYPLAWSHLTVTAQRRSGKDRREGQCGACCLCYKFVPADAALFYGILLVF